MKRTVNLRDMSAANNGQAAMGNQEMQTRKILSDLQKEKARLRMLQQGGGGGPGPSAPARLPLNPPLQPGPIDNSQHMGMTQRNALQMAHSTSFGYFIPQDSAFGNVILPVIPRVAGIIAPVLGVRASTVKRFTEDEVRRFAELTGDHNPIHLDPQFTRQTGIFPRPIVHAALVNGLVSALIGSKLPGPGSVPVMEAVRYPAPLFVGDAVRAEVIVTSVKRRFVDLSVECTNMDAEEEKKVMLGKITVMMTQKT